MTEMADRLHAVVSRYTKRPDDEAISRCVKDILEALREPTGDMLDAGWGHGGTPADIWPAMVDSALGQTGNQ
jgi:hypothetical protein